MTITLHLPPDVERWLRETAAAKGVDVSAYALEVVRRASRKPDDAPPSEEEIDEVVEAARDALWRDRTGGVNT